MFIIIITGEWKQLRCSSNDDWIMMWYGAGELSVFCQSYFNKTLIGQAGSIGGKTRQEVEVMQ